jgi:hypothetical protein
MTDPAELLSRARTIAVVGLSRYAHKTAQSVPAQLQEAGFDIVPVNPYADQILGERAYASLLDIPGDIDIDIVNVFRPSEDTPAVARDAVARGAKALWLQQDIVSAEARAIAEAAGLDYVEDACIAVVRSINRITPAHAGA